MSHNHIKTEMQKIEIPPELHQRSKLGIQQAKLELEESKARNTYNSRKMIVAAMLGMALLSTAIFHTEVVGAVKKVLQYIPGIGMVQEDDSPTERYILHEPVTKKVGNGTITISAILVEPEMTMITVVGKNVDRVGLLKLVIEKGSEYTIPSSQSLSSSNEWTASYWHEGQLDITEDVTIIFDNKQEIVIPIKLEKAQSYESYQDLGEMNNVNGLEIIAIPQRMSEKARVGLISQSQGNFTIVDYGLSGMYAREDQMITISDNLGNNYKIEQSPGNMAVPAREFFFSLSKDHVESYTLTIPEIYAEYKDEATVTLPIPESELSVEETFTLANSPVEITTVKRVNPGTIRIYVNVNFDESAKKSLHNFRIKNMSYMAKVSETTGVIEYLEFEIDPNSSKVKLTFEKPQVLIKGPWKFEFPVDKYLFTE